MICRRFEEFGFPLVIDEHIIPDDKSTLFICSGMQRIRQRFSIADGSTYGSLQSCIRTNDLDLVGDGTHLTSFSMLGNFSFAGPSYRVSVELWNCLVHDLRLTIDSIHVHPDQNEHKQLWQQLGYVVVDDQECVWSDGQIGGFCCEMYCQGLEIGNLVNPLGHSTDVGFGFERLIAVLEQKNRVDETYLFDQTLDPITRDHVRTVDLLHKNDIYPGAKGRNSICRKLLRRILDKDVGTRTWTEWIESERDVRTKALSQGKRLWRRHKDKPASWWWETCGLTDVDLKLLA